MPTAPKKPAAVKKVAAKAAAKKADTTSTTKKRTPKWFEVYAKGVVSLAISVVMGAVAQGLIVGAAAAWVTLVIGGLATAGVVGVGNAKKK
jgi:hypothetical protein